MARRPEAGYAYQKLRARILARHPRCAYCPEPATTLDHVPPLCEFEPGRWRGKLVPSCLRCNQRRGGWRLANARKRARVVKRPLPRPSRRWT